jgi:hypothetical protein
MVTVESLKSYRPFAYNAVEATSSSSANICKYIEYNEVYLNLWCVGQKQFGILKNVQGEIRKAV